MAAYFAVMWAILFFELGFFIGMNVFKDTAIIDSSPKSAMISQVVNVAATAVWLESK